MDIVSKIIFFLKKPKIIVVTGKSRVLAAEAIFHVLKQRFKVEKVSGDKLSLKFQENEILIFESGDQEIKKLSPLFKNSQNPTLVVTHIGNFSLDKDSFDGQKDEIRETIELVKSLPPQTNLILNFDDEAVRELKKINGLGGLTFGFQNGSDSMASDIRLNQGINFKVNYKGNSVPIWLEKCFGKEQVYSALSAVCVGIIFGLNLVEISEALKNYHSLPGKMKLIGGIKNSWILDNSDSLTVFSTMEAIEVSEKIEWVKRKIFVFGDIAGTDLNADKDYEAIGARIEKSADLIFTFGSKAKFIAKGAIEKGASKEKIFQFNNVNEGKIKVQDKMQEGDLILVTGSKEMGMGKIVEEIKAKFDFK